MIVKKVHIPRRTVLRGIGATLALPWLDAMVPALAPRTLAAAPVRRCGAVFVPMGMNMALWTPAKDGDLELSPILQPLAEFRDRYVLSYTPTGVSPTGWHRLDVKLKGKSGKVTARRGYFAE